MIERLRGALVVGVFSLLTSACSSAGVPLPQHGGTTAGSSAGAPLRERIRIHQFSDLPSDEGYPAPYFPTTLTVGPDGALWVADDMDQDSGPSAIVRITKTGKRTNTFYYKNYASPSFADIVTGPDGALWMTDWGDLQIVRMTTGGAFTLYPVSGAGLAGIVSGPDRALWFVENLSGGAAVARISTTGQITSFSKGISSGAALQDITVGPDGALWFTEFIGDRIGRITKHGKVSEYSAGISPGSEPYSIAPGHDGALWFTEMKAGRIGRITTNGSVTEYSHGITDTENPVDIAAGPDGAMWFSEYEQHGSYEVRASKIGRITTSGKVSEYSNLDAKAGPTGIVQGPDGNMWFVETHKNRLGRARL